MRLHIQYKDNQPVPIFTQNVKVPEGEQPTIADLIAAFFPNTPPNELGQFSLHYEEGGEALRPGLALSKLIRGQSDLEPLIIKSRNEEQGIDIVMVGASMDVDGADIYLQKGWSVEDLERDVVLSNCKELVKDAEQITKMKELKEEVINGVKIPFFKEKPSLLFWKLGDFKDVKELYRRATEEQLTVMIGTSGCGKTKEIFEVLSKTYGIYITYQEGSIPGSVDMRTLITKLDKHLKIEEPDENKAYIDRFILCIVGARLWMFHHCHETLKVQFSPKEWLIFQLRFDFTRVIDEFRKFDVHELKHQVEKLVEFMKSKKPGIEKSKHIPIFFDEASVTINMYQRYFWSSQKLQIKPLYYALVSAFLQIPGCSIITCGTGLRLKDAVELMSSAVAKTETVSSYYVANTFDSETDINGFASAFFENGLEEVDSYLLIGRVRFLTTYIEQRLDTLRFGQDVYMVLGDYKQTLLGRYHEMSLLKYFERTRFNSDAHYAESLNVLKECLFHYLYFGKPCPIGSGNFWLFERSFGILKSTGTSQYVEFEEPLMLEASKVFFSEDATMTEGEYCGISMTKLIEHFESRVMSSMTFSGQGYEWELYLATKIMEKCGEDASVLFGDQAVEFSGKGSLLNANAGPPMFSTGKELELAEYLNDPKTPFYLPIKDAGPDIVFFVQFAEDKKNPEKIPVFLQSKLRREVSCVAGLKTTDPKYFYCYRTEDAGVRDEWKSSHDAVLNVMRQYPQHLGILIAYPKKWEFKTVSIKTGPRFEQLFDYKNIKILLDQAHLDGLDYLKEITGS